MSSKSKPQRQIPIKELQEGRYYLGKGRNSDVGYWDGQKFWVISTSHFIDPARYPKGTRLEVRLKNEWPYSRKGGTFKPYRLIQERH